MLCCDTIKCPVHRSIRSAGSSRSSCSIIISSSSSSSSCSRIISSDSDSGSTNSRVAAVVVSAAAQLYSQRERMCLQHYRSSRDSSSGESVS